MRVTFDHLRTARARNVQICASAPMSVVKPAVDQIGGSSTLVASRGVTEHGCGRLAMRLRAYFA
jgi:hypothetical protein